MTSRLALFLRRRTARPRRATQSARCERSRAAAGIMIALSNCAVWRPSCISAVQSDSELRIRRKPDPDCPPFLTAIGLILHGLKQMTSYPRWSSITPAGGGGGGGSSPEVAITRMAAHSRWIRPAQTAPSRSWRTGISLPLQVDSVDSLRRMARKGTPWSVSDQAPPLEKRGGTAIVPRSLVS